MLDFNFNKNKIFHVASMARSGETLILKILAVHPNIVIVHNLDKYDETYKDEAFRFLKNYEGLYISRKHPLIKPYKLKRKQILLLKQGVWKHRYPYKGFVLVRNPIAVYSSLKAYDKDLPEYNLKNNFWFGNNERILRWLNDIEKDSVEFSKDLPPLEQFCFFYNLRIKQLLNTNLEIIRYEDIILDTNNVLKKICNILEVEMNEKLLYAHKFYDKGLEGHGKTDLSKPLDKSSLVKYKTNVSNEEFEFIKKNTVQVYTKLGYQLINCQILYANELSEETS